MKRNIVLSLVLLGIITVGCEDMKFIQPDPPRLLTEEIALSNLDGAEAVLRSAYNRLINQNYYGQRMMIAPDALADNLEIGNNTGRYTGEVVNSTRAHIELMNNTTAYTVRSSYNAYQTINDCNIVLYALDVLGLRAEDEDRAAILEGEAKFIRALNYFDLMRVYAYEPGNEVSGWDAGVVIRTEAVVAASGADSRVRSSNQDVYDLIEEDLTDAISLLPAEGSTASFPHRASTLAARALRARMHLYLGNWVAAYTDAELVLANTTATLSDAAGYAASWTAANHPEALFELNITTLDWNSVDGVNASLASVTRTADAAATPAPLPASQGAVKASDELLAAHETGDVRLDLWVTNLPDHYEMLKWNGEAGDFREDIPLIRYSEVLLIAAEARARNNEDVPAQNHINELRTNRGLGATALTGAALQDLIMNERRVELVLEGHRFFDLKRLQMEVPKPADLGVSNLAATDFRVLADIPESYISRSDNLVEQNPGY